MLFKISAMKTLLISAELDEEMKNKIIKFFFMKYFTIEDFSDADLEMILEDRMVLILISLFKPTVNLNSKGIKEVVPMTNHNICKILTKVHKMIQEMIRKKKLNIEVDTSYMQYYQQFTSLFKNKEKDNSEKIYPIAKLGLIVLFLYLKKPNEYQDILADLVEIVKFDENWMKVFTDLTISILHRGNNSLSEFTLNSFKKLAKFINKDGVDVILQFISETRNENEIENEEIEEDIEMTETNGKI